MALESPGLTEGELAALDKLRDAWMALCDLPRCHPTEIAEAAPHFHHLQQSVMKRAAVRAHPQRFICEEGFK